MIRQEVIDRILDRADIVQVIGDCIELTRKGSNYVACCPFHQEKTPSFHVSPARQTWHCFGGCQEGGNVIGFVMKHEALTFPEAVKKLAKRYGIEVEEDTSSPEEQQARLKREALAGINERVAAFYAGQIRAKTPDAVAAWNYSVNRFGSDYTREAGIGYAPDAWDTLYEWALRKGENIELMVELGLLVKNEEKGKIYDAYRNRLMIPIRDRRRAVEGFTARRMSDENTDIAKYKNSKDSELYNKSKSVFGIDVAWKEAVKSGLFYLVEGAPDAMKMHSVGIMNVVAPLGGAWTKGQLEILKKAASCVCFINDADSVKKDEEWGAGIQYVIDNGRKATELGFSVTVRELQCLEGNKKQDPGDFFTHRNKLQELKEEDYILWYARKLLKKDDTVHKRTENISKIVQVACHIGDDMRLELLLPELNKLHKGKELWKSSIQKAKWEQSNAEKKKKGEVDLIQYGFREEHGCYVGLTDKGDSAWSNFTMRPLFHIRDAESPKRLFHVKNNRGKEDIVEMNIEELVSISKFRQRLEGMGNYTWIAGDRELIKLKSYLYEQTETAQIIRQMGWNTAGFFAFGNGIWYDGKFHEADEYGVCRMEAGNWYIPAASKLYKEDRKKFERERKFIHQSINSIRMGDYLEKFVEVYGNNGKVGLCYFVASLFRDIVTSHTRSFPILDLFGPKGSGKTELGAALMAFFIPENKAPNLKNSTATALNDDVAFASNAMVHLDEYKNDVRPDKIEFLKGLYDGVGRVKMSGSGYDNRIMTSVKSGVIMSGQEMPTADIALFHRCIYLSFPRSEFTVGERQRFAELREIQKLGLTHLTLEILSLRKSFEGLFRDKYNMVLNDINEHTNFEKFETRIVENWAKALASFASLESFLPWPFTYQEMLDITCSGIRTQNELSGTGNELAQYWRTVAYLVNSGELYYGSDYVIKSVSRIDHGNEVKDFESVRRVLFVNPVRIYQNYKMACIKAQENALPKDSMEAYLENSDYYLGKGCRVRFKRIIRGYTETYECPDGKRRDVSQQVRTVCFDYDMLCDRYGIDLEDGTYKVEEEEKNEERPQYRQQQLNMKQ